MPRAKTELVIVHTDTNGKEHQYKVMKLENKENKENQIEWVKRAIEHKIWEDDQPAAGMESGCW